MSSSFRPARVVRLTACALALATVAWLGATRLVNYDFSPVASHYIPPGGRVLVGDIDANDSPDLVIITPRHIVASQFQDNRNLFDRTLPPDWIVSPPLLARCEGTSHDLLAVPYLTNLTDSSQCMLFTPGLATRWSTLEPESRLRWPHRDGGPTSTFSAYLPMSCLTINGRQSVIVNVHTEFYKVDGEPAPRSLDVFDLASGRRMWSQLMGPAPMSIALYDLDGDGEDEIVVGTYAPNNGPEASGTKDDECWVFAFDQTGQELWRVQVGGVYCGAEVIVCDLDGDGRPEVLAGLACVESGASPGTILVLDPETGREIGRARWEQAVVALLNPDSLGVHERDGRVLAVVKPPEVLLLGPDLSPRRRQPLGGPEVGVGLVGTARVGEDREPLLLVDTSGSLRGFDGQLRLRCERPYNDPERRYGQAVRSGAENSVPDRIAIQDGAIVGLFDFVPQPAPSWMWITGAVALLLMVLDIAWPWAVRWWGTRVGDYILLGKHPLGEGGMGEAWLARPMRSGNVRDHVVIKFLGKERLNDKQSRARFTREARILKDLVHENIAQLFHTDVDDKRPYLVMQLVPGITLEKRLDGLPTGLDVKAACTIARHVARALEYAHRQGVVHRDVKPLNVIVDEGLKATLIDFGLAKALDPSTDLGPRISLSQDCVGTPGYMPPERIMRALGDLREAPDASDWQGDVWGFGAVFYRCLTGRLAYGTFEDMRRLPEWEGLPPMFHLRCCTSSKPA